MQIPLPPIPVMPEGVEPGLIYGGIAATAILSIALLLWGRTILGRIVLTLAAMGGGYLLAGYFTEYIPVSPLTVQITTAVILGLIAVIGARILWALLGAAVFEAIAVALMVGYFIQNNPSLPWPAFTPAPDFAAYLAELGRYALGCLEVARGHNQTTLLMVTIPACLLPLMVGLVQPRIASIFVTSLAGAVGLTGSLWYAAVLWRSTLWPEEPMRLLIPAGVALVLAIIGWVFQGAAEAAAMAAARKADEEAKAKEAQKKKEDRVPGIKA